MLLARQVFQAKYGRGDELVALLKELQQRVPSNRSPRLLTDASGRFFTVVWEYEVESFSEWEQTFRESMEQLMAQPEMRDWFSRTMEVVESGSREFYNIVE